MARVRQTPRCPKCGEVIAKAIHKDYSKYPKNMIPYGDSFIRWEYIEHECKGSLYNRFVKGK